MTAARRLLPLGCLVFVVLLQVSVVQRIAVSDASPDLVILAIVSFALLSNSLWGAIFGFTAGLTLALAAALPLGPHALIGAVLGYWAGRWGESLVTDEHPLPPLLAGVVATLGMHVGRPLLEFLVNPSVTTIAGIWSDAVIVTALNLALITPFYLLTRHVLGPSLADLTTAPVGVSEAVEQ